MAPPAGRSIPSPPATRASLRHCGFPPSRKPRLARPAMPRCWRLLLHLIAPAPPPDIPQPRPPIRRKIDKQPRAGRGSSTSSFYPTLCSRRHKPDSNHIPHAPPDVARAPRERRRPRRLLMNGRRPHPSSPRHDYPNRPLGGPAPPDVARAPPWERRRPRRLLLNGRRPHPSSPRHDHRNRPLGARPHRRLGGVQHRPTGRRCSRGAPPIPRLRQENLFPGAARGDRLNNNPVVIPWSRFVF